MLFSSKGGFCPCSRKAQGIFSSVIKRTACAAITLSVYLSIKLCFVSTAKIFYSAAPYLVSHASECGGGKTVPAEKEERA